MIGLTIVNHNGIHAGELSQDLQMFNYLFQALAKTELSAKKLQGDINTAKEEALSAKQMVQAIRDVISLNSAKWRGGISSIITKIAIAQGGTSEAYRKVREESYELLDAS